MVASRTTFVVARMELADDVRFVVPHMPPESPLAEKTSMAFFPEL